jgi:hypothetical protein
MKGLGGGRVQKGSLAVETTWGKSFIQSLEAQISAVVVPVAAMDGSDIKF